MSGQAVATVYEDKILVESELAHHKLNARKIESDLRSKIEQLSATNAELRGQNEHFRSSGQAQQVSSA